MCDCAGGPTPITDWACGDVVCRECGVVVEGHIIDESPEWRVHEGEDYADKCRVGAASASLGTYLDGMGGGSRKRRRGPVLEPGEQSLRDGLRVVADFVGRFRQSSTGAIARTARMLFEDAHAVRPVRSDIRNPTAAAAVYLACKLEDTARELRQVAEVCQIDQKALNAATADLKVALRERPYHLRLYATLEASKLLDIFLDKLGLDPTDRKRAWRASQALAGRLRSLLDCGRKPRTICSGLLYVAMQDEGIATSKKDVTEACAVCQQTLDKVVAQIRGMMLETAV